jgi:hypothetical protein
MKWNDKNHNCDLVKLIKTWAEIKIHVMLMYWMCIYDWRACVKMKWNERMCKIVILLKPQTNACAESELILWSML